MSLFCEPSAVGEYSEYIMYNVKLIKLHTHIHNMVPINTSTEYRTKYSYLLFLIIVIALALLLYTNLPLSENYQRMVPIAKPMTARQTQTEMAA